MKRGESGPARELTKRDWVALHTLIFELGAIVIEQGVDSLPAPLQGLLVPPPPPFQPDTIMGRKWKGTPDPDASLVDGN